MKTRAAAARAAGEPLTIEEVDLELMERGESIRSVVVY